MTARIFQALARHAVKTPHSAALRSAERCIDYAALVAFLAANGDMLAGTQRVIGINTADPLDAALADLALVYYGHVPVHLPPFFSVAQKAHIITATGMDIVVGDAVAGAKAMQLCRPEDSRSLAALAPPVANARRIIFTSGSSGQPRGVVIGERQMAAALDGLEKAIRPDVSDIHLSLLPMAQLLEQIAGLYLPLLAGAQVRFCPEALPALFGGPMAPVLAALHDAQPTSTILVPAFLARLVSDLRATGRRAPDSLRLIAVGGAATSPALLADAISEGLPVYEGYGLSECCSVVSLNRPGTARSVGVSETVSVSASVAGVISTERSERTPRTGAGPASPVPAAARPLAIERAVAFGGISTETDSPTDLAGVVTFRSARRCGSGGTGFRGPTRS